MQLWTKNELMMAVSTVMTNWMMVFQVFRSFRNFIIVKSEFSFLCRWILSHGIHGNHGDSLSVISVFSV